MKSYTISSSIPFTWGLKSVDDMVTAAVKAQGSGFKCSVMILLGLAGKTGSAVHAPKTAEALNRMQPRLLSALRFIEVPGTKMYDGYEAVSEYEAMSELKSIIEALDLRKTVFRANHSSNRVPLSGRFSQRSAGCFPAESSTGKGSGIFRSSCKFILWRLCLTYRRFPIF